MASHLNPRFLLKLRKESKAIEITDFVYSEDEGMMSSYNVMGINYVDEKIQYMLEIDILRNS